MYSQNNHSDSASMHYYCTYIMNYEEMTKAELISKIELLESGFKDTDARGTVEEELIKSEEKHRRLIESLQDNIFLYSHNTEGVFTYISSSITNVLGYPQDEFLDHFSKYMTDNPSNEGVIKHTGLSLRGIKQPSYEVEIYHKNGSVRILKVQEVPVFDEEGKVVSVEGIAEDITERKQIEEALFQSEKLKAMGVMTSGISHEFNNILAVIKGFALLLKQKYGDHKEINNKINVILKSVTDGIGIVNRMQEFTRSEVDRAEFEPVDVRELVEDVIEFSMPRWKTISEASGITYHIDKEGLETVPRVCGNNTELREVILNIINNSLDAMPEGGHLSFRTWKNDDNVFLSILDTGEGMYEDIRKNIFDPFLTTKMPKGAGLGMSVSYGIIKRHSGMIYVKSEVGRGTTITIQLPISKDINHIDTISEPMHKLEVANLHILVVDDEQAVCEFLSEFLTQEEQNVKSVFSGKDAIKLLKSENFDLVLCDLVMPDVGGREVIKMLDTLEKSPEVGLITGWSEKLETFHKENLKVDFIVKKPFDFSELSKQINNVFRAPSKNS